MAENITGNQDGPNGENQTYRIPGRGTAIPRATLVQKIESGQHPGLGTYTLNGVSYVRANPDSTTRDNVNKE